MTDESPAGVEAAPELEVTAPPVAEVQTPEDVTPKTFSNYFKMLFQIVNTITNYKFLIL